MKDTGTIYDVDLWIIEGEALKAMKSSQKKTKWVSWNDHGIWRVGNRIGGPSFDFRTMTQKQAYAIKDLFNELDRPKRLEVKSQTNSDSPSYRRGVRDAKRDYPPREATPAYLKGYGSEYSTRSDRNRREPGKRS